MRASSGGQRSRSRTDKIRLIVADDHVTVLEGLVAILGRQPDMQVLAAASNGREAVELTPAQSEWQVPVGAAPSVEGLTQQPVRLPPKTSFFEQAKGLVLNPACKRAAVGYTLNDPRQKSGGTRVVLCDLTAGKLLGSASAPGRRWSANR